MPIPAAIKAAGALGRIGVKRSTTLAQIPSRAARAINFVADAPR